MCTVSMVSDGWRDQFPQRWPNTHEYIFQTPGTGAREVRFVSQEEFDALKAEVQELRKLLEAAKAFDAKTGQPECHVDEKVAFIKKIAEFVGVDLKDVLE